MLSEHIQSVLHRAGWSTDRSIPIDDEVKALQNEGYLVFPAVKRFLQNFGRLSIEWQSQETHSAYRLHFFAVDAAAEVYNEGYISKYADRIGQPVCVIGEIQPDATTLIMDEHGRVFGGFEDHLVLFGNDSFEAVENILNSRNNGVVP